METQKPAVGILQRDTWGDSYRYHIQCDCAAPEHSHEVTVTCDQGHVGVEIDVTAYTPYHNTYWQILKHKLSVTWKIWTQGYVEMHHELLMKPQAALNYAQTLKQAVADQTKLRDEKSQ